MVDGVTVKVPGTAAWITLTDLVIAPPATTIVIVELRVNAFGFAVAVKVIVESFEPDAALSVNHVSASALVMLHDMLELILNVAVLLAPASIVNADGDTNKTGAIWVTVIVFVTPEPETVTVAIRAVAPGLTCAVKIIVSLFKPEAGLTVNHV